MADFRGKNDTFFALLSAPGVQFAAKTMDSDFLLPRPQLVHGSFFTDAAWMVLGLNGDVFAIQSSAEAVGFKVSDGRAGKLIVSRSRIWQTWASQGVFALMKQSTLMVRANGWEVNATRRPIYNYVSGPKHWRYDLAMRKLDGTVFAQKHGNSSKFCWPHGILGQSWDGDGLAVNGRKDDYKYDASKPVITTVAMAEGAIEGYAAEYALKSYNDTRFRYSRFHRRWTDPCAPRDVRALRGLKQASDSTEVASSVDDDE